MQTVTFNSIEKLDFRTKESYKTLRTNLEFSGKDRKVISITSSTPNEGKTSVSFQLARVNCGRREKGYPGGCRSS
mgnify:CR=1 FL=1